MAVSIVICEHCGAEFAKANGLVNRAARNGSKHDCCMSCASAAKAAARRDRQPVDLGWQPLTDDEEVAAECQRLLARRLRSRFAGEWFLADVDERVWDALSALHDACCDVGKHLVSIRRGNT